jgi:hypothetical protein
MCVLSPSEREDREITSSSDAKVLCVDSFFTEFGFGTRFVKKEVILVLFFVSDCALLPFIVLFRLLEGLSRWVGTGGGFALTLTRGRQKTTSRAYRHALFLCVPRCATMSGIF